MGLTIVLTCKDYLLEEGNALFIPGGWDDNTASTHELLTAHKIANLQSRLAGGELTQLELGEGSYRLLITDLKVQGIADRAHTIIPAFLYHSPLTLTNEQLRNAKAVFELSVEGLFQLRLVDRAGRRRPHGQITLHKDLFSITIPANDEGSITILGSPFHFYVELKADEGISILPV
jgi:hypothetical protein